MTTTATQERAAPAALARWARGPVLTIAVATGLLMLVTSGRYGYFIDELYFLSAGARFSWGYADQPWLLPALAHAMDTLFPGSVVGLRLPVTLGSVAGVLTTAGLARELGGAGRAQTLAAALYAVATGTMFANHTLATHALDPLLWAGIVWALVRWTRRNATGASGDGPLLVAAGLTAVALQVKYLVPALWAAVLLCALVFGPRRLLTRPALWIGLAVAAATAVPSVWWQATNGWPQLAMTRAITDSQGGDLLARIGFVGGTLMLAGLVSGLVTAVYGVVALLRRPEFAPYRYLAVAALLVVVVFLVAGGRPTYVVGLFPLLWAVSAVRIADGRASRWWRWLASWPVLVVSAAISVLMVLPVLPLSTVDPDDGLLLKPGSTGWPGMVDRVAAVAASLPPGTVIVTGSYPQAAAIEHFGDGRIREPVVSPNLGFWFLAAPPPDAPSVLVVGDVLPRLRSAFRTATPLGAYDNPQGIATVNGHVTLTLLTGRTEPWPRLWDDVRSLRPIGG